MIDHSLISVDIGSTWTKAARFVLRNDRFEVVKRSVVPTTVAYLPDGFYAALNLLDAQTDWRSADAALCPLRFSSSAKGGLRVAVVGLVPEMSLEIGRLTAFSAGARICAAFPYRLTRGCIAKLERMQPDILLLCGGTDGGNERYVRENAVAIAASDFAGTIVYAGNNQAADAIVDTLAGRDLRLAENLMPDFGRLNVESARNAIRQVFLDRIVSGKGLDRLVAQFACEPLPTPLSVYHLVEAIGQNVAGWQNFALIDMGGATTDFYTYTEAWHPDSGTVLKGIVEPRLKRTVEGDLGLRVSAASVLEAAKEWLEQQLLQTNTCFEKMIEYVDRLETGSSYLPAADNEQEQWFDQLLAEACVNHAMTRHAGTIEEVYTTAGPVWAQHGKDLRRIERVVGSGGYLAARGREGEACSFSPVASAAGKISLLPGRFNYYADCDYIWPLLGNLAVDFPLAASRTAVDMLSQSRSVSLNVKADVAAMNQPEPSGLLSSLNGF